MLRFSLFLAGLLFSASPLALAAPVTAQSRATTGRIAASTQVFRSLGVLGGGAHVARTRVFSPLLSTARSGSSTRAVAAAPLTFQFDNGFSSTQKSVLSNYLRANYDRMVALYGAPAPEQAGKTILVRSDSSVAAYQPVLRPSATDGGTIFFRYVTGDSAQINTFEFSRLVLLAFQGPHTFSYNFAQGDYIETWQSGFADAAALLIAFGAAGSPADFDPSQLGAYVLPVYDFFNRPELGNAYIYSRSGDDLVIADFRAAMAQAAWLKVAIENPQFFVRFNAAYYARFPARTGVNPNTLRALAAEIAPTVEGLPFQDWVRRQYVLDTSVTTGQKIYAAVLPLPVLASGDTRSGFNGFAQAFTTDSRGDEVPSTGYGSVAAFDESGANINSASTELRASTLLDFTAESQRLPGQATFGAGFSDLGTPDQARVTLKVRFKAAETTALFPYISTSGASNISYYGVTTQGESGNLAISSNNGIAETVSVARGAWGGARRYVSAPRVVTTLSIAGKQFVRNSAWLAAGDAARGQGFVLEGGAPSASFALKAGAGASRVRMISLPLYPTQSDEAQILGVAPSDLELARYRPNLAPGTLRDGALTFGIGGDRHEIYPNISAPIAPGRGYWLGVDGDYSRTVRGSEPARDRPFESPLLGGWNQIGVPFNRAFAFGALRVRYGGFAPVSYATAIQNGWIRPGIWRWQPRGGYARVDVADGKLEPFVGYFIYAVPSRGVALIFDPNASSEPATITNGWTVPLVASSSVSRDASNRFGVSTQIAAAKPPAGAPSLTLRFLSSGKGEEDSSGAGAASGWADSFLASLKREGYWTFVVEGSSKNTRVALAWGNLASVPRDVKLVLQDEKSGTVRRLSAKGSYQWQSDGAPRKFSLRATRIAQASLKIVAAPSQGVDVWVTMNLAAPGRLEVQNETGDTVMVLKSGNFSEKTEKFTWLGRQTSGKAAGGGNYRVVWLPQVEGDRGAARTFEWR
jgi:hypothetical protein